MFCYCCRRFSEKDGHLYELDGRKRFPINHGATTPATLLLVRPLHDSLHVVVAQRCSLPSCRVSPQDACRVIQGFMARDEGEMRFTITALAPTVDDE